MNTWAPLWNGIVDSSIWCEPDTVIKVFLTMLALKDADHVCRLNAFQLSQRSHKTEVEVLDALKVLSQPDGKRVEPQPFEGRRIRAVEDGWLILNGEKYREMVRREMIKAKNRRSQAAFRQRMKESGKVSGKYKSSEKRYNKAYGDGDVQTCDSVAAEGL